jgi:hypothetical protein
LSGLKAVRTDAETGRPGWVFGGLKVGRRGRGVSGSVPVKVEGPAGIEEVRSRFTAHPLVELILGWGNAQDRISALERIEVLPAGGLRD